MEYRFYWIMAFTLWSLLEAALLFVNAIMHLFVNPRMHPIMNPII